MQFKAKVTPLSKIEAGALVLFVSEEGWEKELLEVDKILSGNLVNYLKQDGFKAKEGTIHRFPTLGKLTTPTLYIVSLGKRKEATRETLMKLSAKVAKSAKQAGKKTFVVNLMSDVLSFESIESISKAVAEGAALGTYSFSKYRSEDKKEPKVLDEVYLLTNASHIQHVTNSLKEAEVLASATTFARDLVNESPSVTTPTYLSQVAKTLAKRGEVKVEVLEESQVRKLGMHAFLAVSRASEEAPKFIKLSYKGGGRKKVVIAGKAITFDTGGLSLKDSKNMETMKLDMAGAAAVLGVFKALPEFKPKATIVGLIAACENMPGPRAIKPGDVVTAMNGKTIEILNTDAEGRLTLADVLSYATAKEKPDFIVDLATLTGACMVALGEEIAGLFSNSKELTQKLLEASRVEGEKLWELPLEKDYKESIKSDIADLRNTSKTRYGGAITAALFLEEFVGSTPWAHLDIAGPAFEEKDTPVVPKGGSGFGVRTLLHFLKNL